VLVIYAILTEQNIAKLFAAAFIQHHRRGRVPDRDCVYVRVHPTHGPAQPRHSNASGSRRSLKSGR